MIEIACDESGWEGANLVAGRSVVIAYASVQISADTAAEWLLEFGGRAGNLKQEYKASHFLRADRRTVTRLLGPDGPVHGNAFVHLTEKAYFVVGRVLDLILGQYADTASAGLAGDPRIAQMATVLHREGPGVFGPERWQSFLAASNGLLRVSRLHSVRGPVDEFVGVVDKLRADGPIGAALDELRQAKADTYDARERLIDDHVLLPSLEPLIPALARTILHWSSGGETDLAVVHDEQSALTERRIRRLESHLLAPDRRLAFRQVDSRTEPRVQVADVLAGVARRLATDELHGSGDAELAELLSAYVDPASCWSDEQSWARLRPVP